MGTRNVHQHIIDTASDLFYLQGYNATGINSIIAKSQIAKATLYHHFKSKEELCIAYLNQKHHDFMENLKTFIDKKDVGEPKLLGIFDLLRLRYREENFQGCWAIKTLGEIPPNNKNILSVIQAQKKELLLYLGELVAENISNVSKAEVESISGGIYLLYESALTECHLYKNDWPIHLAKNSSRSFYEKSRLLKMD